MKKFNYHPNRKESLTNCTSNVNHSKNKHPSILSLQLQNEITNASNPYHKDVPLCKIGILRSPPATELLLVVRSNKTLRRHNNKQGKGSIYFTLLMFKNGQTQH